MMANTRIRQLVVTTTLISMAGYASVTWVPVYFQPVHGFSTSESGTLLVLVIGLGGGVGTFAGGYFADRLARISEGWRALVVCMVVMVALPMSYIVLHSYRSILGSYVVCGSGLYTVAK